MEKILKIYRLKENHWELNRFSNAFEKIEFIIDRHRRVNHDLDSVGIPVPHLYYKRIHFHLYSFNEVVGESEWKAFLPEFFASHHSFNIQSFSFILFFHHANLIFALVGGRGNYAIKRYIDVNFGLDIVSRVIQPETDTIYVAELRAITGNVAGRKDTFREDQKILDIDAFGKVFKKLKFEIDSNILAAIFDIELNVLRKSKVFADADDAFSLRIGVDFDKFCDQIHKIIKVLEMPEKVALSTFAPIIDDELVQKSINIQLFLTIQQRLLEEKINRGKLLFFDYDFCHPNKMIEFYESDRYQVFGRRDRDPMWETTNKNEIFEWILDYTRENININSLRDVMSFLGGIKVLGIKGDEVLTIAPLMSHLSCEIFYKNQNVYKIDDQWYSVRGNFVEQLNNQCKYIFANYQSPNILPEIWSNPDEKEYSEDWYNKRYLIYDDFIVLDKILGQNIELCDLLFRTEETIYLIHVKKGFNGMMRDLTNQVRIAARRLWIDTHTEEKPFLKEIYNGLLNSSNFQNCWQPDEKEFINLFIDKKVEFVIAFCSMNKTGRRVFREVETFQSNIAKYSLTETIREMKGQDYATSVLEIEHDFK